MKNTSKQEFELLTGFGLTTGKFDKTTKEKLRLTPFCISGTEEEIINKTLFNLCATFAMHYDNNNIKSQLEKLCKKYKVKYPLYKNK